MRHVREVVCAKKALKELEMPLFLLAVFSIYGAVHVYVFFKIRTALGFGLVPGIVLGLFLATMTVTPILVRMLEWQGYDLSARALSCIGYTWMGVLFLFFCASILIDLFRILVYAAGVVLQREPGMFLLSSRVAFFIALIAALGISVYGFFEAIAIRPEVITVPSSKIPASIERVRIVQVSDVHLGLVVRGWRLHRIIDVIREAGPDVLVSTGDLVDGQIDSLQGLPEFFDEIQPRFGKYAVTGNHEFYAGLDHALEITAHAGFIVLRGEAMDVSGMLTIAGVDDPTAQRMGLMSGIPEEDLLPGLSRERFVLLLKHQPYLNQGSLGLFDLQLSGHTHNGQIFPFRFLVRQVHPRVAGWYDLGQGSHLYVSRGTGTWGPPMRFLSPPEVTVIDLVHAEDR
ncbi:MAG: metallophosphoesterase [Desulfomonilia bacterium]|nr:metallophosphoesterase [Desulfomonilia bacterium]